MVGTRVKNQHGGGDSVVLSLDRTQDQTQSMNHVLLAPWPEWNDSEINAEKWNMGYKSSAYQADASKNHSTSILPDVAMFENPLERKSIPASLNDQVHEWKRALSVNPKFQVLPEDSNSLDLDLVSSNGHILHSELMRHLVASITNLYHLAAMKPFQEVGSNTFVPNGGGIWKPWNHVYAICKVGKGTKHKPAVNKFGKYVVRLHFLGQWRRITVDDLLPLDEFGRVLLPMTNRNELWPILLAKAVMLVASLTATPTSEVLEMNAVACFTGWFVLEVECKRVSDKDLWLVCQKALMNEAEDGARYKEEAKATDAYQLGMAMGGGDQKDSLKFAMYNELEEEWGSVAVFAQLADIDEDLEGEVEEIGPCVGHQVLFSEARIIKLGDDGGELPLWKTFRWKKWALHEGLIQPEHLANVKSLRMFAPLKKWLVPRPVTASTIFDELGVLDEAGANFMDDKMEAKPKEKGNGRGVKKLAGKSSGSKSEKSGEKKSGSKETGKTFNEKVGIEARGNTDPWINFNSYSKYLTHLQLFYRPSSFKHCKSTADFHTFLLNRGHQSQDQGVKDNKKKPNIPSKSHRVVQQSHTSLDLSTTKYKMRRTQDYFYVLIDTPTSKKLFITIGVLCPNVTAEHDCLLNQSAVQRQSFSPFSLNFSEHLRCLFPWDVGRLHFNVVGTTTRMLQLEDGLFSFLVVADLPPNHYLQIASQSEFKVGTYEVCHDVTDRPSLSLTKYGTRIFNAFANLKRCEIGSPEHIKALAEYNSAYLPECLATFFTASRTLSRFTTSMRSKCEEVCVGLLYNRLRADFEQFYTALKELQELMMAPNYGFEALLAIAPDFHKMILLRNEAMQRPLDIIHESQEQNVVELAQETDNGKSEKAKNKDAKTKSDKKEKDKNEGGKAKNKKNKLSNPEVPSLSKLVSKEQPPHILFENHENSGSAVLSKIVEDQPDWLKYFPFRGDIEQRTVQQDFYGSAPVSTYGDWFPIVRVIVNVASVDQACFNAIYFTSSAALSFIHVVDNDTQTEKKIFLSNIIKDWYKKNKYGYTIYAYGFCDNANIKEHSWKLHLVAPFTHELLQCCEGIDQMTGICIPPPPQALKVKHVYGHYIPNRRNTVLRCLLTVSCSQILTLRMSLSNPKAEVKVKILHDMDEHGDCKLIYEKKFAGKLTLPSLPFLVQKAVGDVEPEPKPTVFLIDAELANEGAWVLSEMELEMVNTIKERNLQDLLVFHSASNETHIVLSDDGHQSTWSSKRRLPMNEEIVPHSAYWCVQVIVDAELETKVSLEWNNRKTQEIRRLKETWENGDPGRFSRAVSERQRILEQGKEEKRQQGISFAKSKIFQSFQLKESCISKEQRMIWKALAEDYGNEQQERRNKEREEYAIKMNELTEKTAKYHSDQKDASRTLNGYLLSKKRVSLARLESGYKLREASLKKSPGFEGEKEKEKGKRDKKNSAWKKKGVKA